MPNLTNHLKLEKPLQSENYNIDIFNSNSDKIDVAIKDLKDNKVNLTEIQTSANTKYTTSKGVKEFTCKSGYVDNINIQGQTKILNASNVEVSPGTSGARLVSVGQGDKIEVLSRFEGGNLFDGNLELGSFDSSGNVVSSSDCIRSVNYIYLPKATRPNWWCIKEYNPIYVYYDANKRFLQQGGEPPSNTKYMKFRTNIGNKENDITVKFVISYDIATEYVPPKYDKKQISTTLRSLPNGVKDEIVQQGDRYYKIVRCGEYVLTGNDNWHTLNVYTNTVQNGCSVPNLKTNSVLLSDKLSNSATGDNEKITWASDKVYINISKSKLQTADLSGFKAYLNSNPVTVVYELATPQITEIPNPNPRTFADKTTFLLNSGVVQGEASFEVTNSLGSALDVMAYKVSSLDEYVASIGANTLELQLLNGVTTSGNNIAKLITNNRNSFVVAELYTLSPLPTGTKIFKIPRALSYGFYPITINYFSDISSSSTVLGWLYSDGSVSTMRDIPANNYFTISFPVCC